jgi:hypothetical protein
MGLSENQMFTVLWSIKDLWVIEWSGPAGKFEATSFCDITIAKLFQTVYPRRAFPRRWKFSLHLDNARPHNYAKVTEFMQGKNSLD